MAPKSLQVLLFDCLRKHAGFSPESPVISEDQELCLSGQGSFFGPECQGNPRGQQHGVHASTKKEETEFKGQMIVGSSYFYRIFSRTSYELFLKCTDHFFILYVSSKNLNNRWGWINRFISKGLLEWIKGWSWSHCRLTRFPICQQGFATTRRKSEVAIMLDGKAATARTIVGLSAIWKWLISRYFLSSG